MCEGEGDGEGGGYDCFCFWILFCCRVSHRTQRRRRSSRTAGAPQLAAQRRALIGCARAAGAGRACRSSRRLLACL